MLLITASLISIASAEHRIIAKDYYISGRRTIDENVVEVTGVLPNTLLVRVEVGEDTEVRADVVPEAAEDVKLLWSLPEGTGKVEITPEDRICRVRGITEGDETIRVDTPDGAHALVRVRVLPRVERQIILDCEKREIEVGEISEIRARILPESEEEVSWEILKGEKNGDISFDGNVCRIYGKKSGNITLSASDSEGNTAQITVRVSEKKDGSGIIAVMWVLISLAVGMLLLSFVLFITRRRNK